MTNNIYKIECDLDGVIVDFAKAASKIFPRFIDGVTEKDKKLDGGMWKAISNYQRNGGRFWFDCDPTPDAFVLWNFIKPFKPEILTATGNASFGAAQQKLDWVALHLGADVKVNIVEKSKDKAKFATPNTILIDDKTKALDPFIAAGGIGILHTNASSTIEQLKTFL